MLCLCVCVCFHSCVCVWVCICRKTRTLFRHPIFRPWTRHQTWTSADWGDSATWLLILHAFIWESAKYNINITCTRYVHGSSIKFHTQIMVPKWGAQSPRFPVQCQTYESWGSCYLCVFSRSTIYTKYQYVCVCVGLYIPAIVDRHRDFYMQTWTFVNRGRPRILEEVH